MHGVSLSIGSSDPLDFEYLGKLKRLAKEIGAQWISDHICWTGILGRNSHDLLPVPFTEETLRHVTARCAPSRTSWSGPSCSRTPAPT